MACLTTWKGSLLMFREYRVPDSVLYHGVPKVSMKDQILAEAVAELGKTDIDHRPSIRPMRVTEQGKLMTFTLDGPGAMAIEMIVESLPNGKVSYRGMRLCLTTK